MDLVIVVDRLLTGFDAPCMSALFIDRPPMNAHDMIQAFSRTNRVYDRLKTYGQVVMFQFPEQFRTAVNDAIRLYSAGGAGEALVQDWDEVEAEFTAALAVLREIANTPADVPELSRKEKRIFARAFQQFDRLFSQLKSFTCYESAEKYGITEQEYEQYAAHYKNVIDELRRDYDDDTGEGDDSPGGEDELDKDYNLRAYFSLKIDYEYIVSLMQSIVDSMDEEGSEEDFRKRLDEVHEYIESLTKENPKLGKLMSDIFDGLVRDKTAFKGQGISAKLEQARYNTVNMIVTAFANKWHVDLDAVRYAVEYHHDGEIPNSNALKQSLDYQAYKQTTENPVSKFKCYSGMIAELERILREDIMPLQAR